jgi:hypothetical protein
MRKLTFVFVLLSTIFSFRTFATTAIESVYTDTVADCVVVSSATDQAPIDFYVSQCKSFGGYSLGIRGVDLRYGPALSYNGIDLDLQRPAHFHDMATTKIEWLYKRESDEEGSGSLEWKGLIYHLSEANEDGASDIEKVYAVRLQQEKTCVLGVVSDDESARKLILDESALCK